jgi:predicted ATPase
MLEVAEEAIDDYADGVWLVELAPLTDPHLIAERVAAALNIQEQPVHSLLDTLTANLRRKRLLLLLDNVEHLVRETAELAEHLLMNCPTITILATGRESLLIEGETTLQVPSLSLPDSRGDVALEEIRNSEAVQLFLARAQAVRPEFDITPRNGSRVAEIVRRLDGIPLALELAAARLRMMSVAQVADRLNDRFRLLTGGRRTALPRQQTLRALIDWSWDLLEETERALLRRLSVFSGGWTLEAAQVVVSDDPLDEFAVFDRLEQLINKSLVKVDRSVSGEVRYYMLESIHQYGRERLLEAGEVEAMRNRHAEYFTRFGERASEGIQGADMLAWLDRLLYEADNVTVAQEWVLESRLDLALRMAGVSQLVLRYWFFSPEGLHWLEQVAEQTRNHADLQTNPEYQRGLASVVIAMGTVLFSRGANVEARATLLEGIALAQAAGVVEQRVFGMNILLIVLLNMGEFEAAAAVAEDVLALSRKHKLDFLYFMALGSYTSVIAFQGKHEQAQANREEALRLAQQLGNPWVKAMASFLNGQFEKHLENWPEAEYSFATAADLFESARDAGFAYSSWSEVAHIRRKQGDFTGASEVYRQTIIAFHEYENLAAVAHQLECFGIIAAFQEQPIYAANLLGAAQALRNDINSSRLPDEQAEYDEIMAHLAVAIGPDGRDIALATGAMMSVDEAVTLALDGFLGEGFS